MFPLWYTSQLSAPLASTPVKNKPSEDVPGRKLCQRGSPVISSASPVIFKFHYITVFLLIPGEKCLKLFPGKNLKVQRVTWPGCKEIALTNHFWCMNWLNTVPQVLSFLSFTHVGSQFSSSTKTAFKIGSASENRRDEARREGLIRDLDHCLEIFLPLVRETWTKSKKAKLQPSGAGKPFFQLVTLYGAGMRFHAPAWEISSSRDGVHTSMRVK